MIIQQEHKYVWRQRKTILSALFLLIRYLPILSLGINGDFSYDVRKLGLGANTQHGISELLHVCTMGWMRIFVAAIVTAATEGTGRASADLKASE